jgi:hypothetical protein
MRWITPRAVTGLARNSLTPASRASATRRIVEWPVIMMTGANGAGLSGELRSRLTKSMPSSGPMVRSVMTRSISVSRIICSASAPSMRLEDVPHAERPQDLGQQHAHVLIVVDQQDLQQIEAHRLPPAGSGSRPRSPRRDMGTLRR